MTRGLAAAYLYDEDLHAAANARDENHWDTYIPEIAEQMGLPVERVAPTDLASAASLARYSALLLGRLAPAHAAAGGANLRRWVEAGGLLIGFGTEGLDDLFGVRQRATLAQPSGPFSIGGLMRPQPHPLTAGIESTYWPDQPLLIFSPARVVDATDAETVAALLSPEGSEPDGAAMSARSVGRGLAFYAAFSLPQTMWVLHKGRPITGDNDGDGYWRVGELIPIGRHHQEVQYADELLYVLQNVISRTGQPLIHQLPPKDDGVPDLLCFWGGDDEAATNGLQRVASDFMKEVGLPYHNNAMPVGGAFGLSVADAKHIIANGHEVSLHYNFRDGFAHPGGYTRDDIFSQFDGFRRTYGFEPVCTVNHCGHWTGWVEPAEWMHEAGGRADNSFIHQQYPPMNAVNAVGFSFGTAYPHYFYRDHRGSNSRFDFLEQPIVSYEVGYTPDGTDFPKLHKILDHAARFHLTLNTFYHPVYIAEWPTCRLAIKETVRYLDERQVDAVHLGNDALWRWWDGRHRSTLEDVQHDGKKLSMRVHAASPDGLIVKAPLGDGEAAVVTVDGRPTTCVCREEFGQNWAFVVVPAGAHRVSIDGRSS